MRMPVRILFDFYDRFQVDGSNKEKQQDFEGVRGDFVNNPFVTAVQEHIVNKRALGDELIERLKPLV